MKLTVHVPDQGPTTDSGAPFVVLVTDEETAILSPEDAVLSIANALAQLAADEEQPEAAQDKAVTAEWLRILTAAQAEAKRQVVPAPAPQGGMFGAKK